MTLDLVMRQLFEEGSIVFSAVPEVPEGSARDGAREVLRDAYERYRLDIAGPPLDLEADLALQAAVYLVRACWFLVSYKEPGAEVERQLILPGPPRTPAQHLSADLLLRYLPAVHRRARARDRADLLTRCLERTLREWPLSGVLSDLTEAPVTALDFGGHSGLQLLYAERLAKNKRPAWVPDGRTGEYCDLVKHMTGEGA